MSDLISRNAVLDAITESINQFGGRYTAEQLNMWGLFTQMVQGLPSAETEIIRCKDCKYRDENWRRVSVRWLPCMDVRTGGNWYCGSAERRTDG